MAEVGGRMGRENEERRGEGRSGGERKRERGGKRERETYIVRR